MSTADLDRDDPVTALTDATPLERILTRLFGKRRRYLVHWRYQIRMSTFPLIAVGAVLIVLLAFNWSAHALSESSTRELLGYYPEIGDELRRMDRFQLWSLLVGSLVFGAGIFVLGVLRSHRTAGAAFNLHRCLDRVAAGSYQTTATLRRDDDLQELAGAFNRMAEGLRRQATAEIDILEKLATTVAALPTDPNSRQLHAELQKLIIRKRHTLD